MPRISRNTTAAAERHHKAVEKLWRQRQAQQQIDDAAVAAAYLEAKPKEQPTMSMQPMTLPPGTERQHWQLVLGALCAQHGEDDAMTPIVLDELRASPTGGGPLLLALSATVATQLAQQHDDPITVIRQHLAELAAEDDARSS